LSFNLELFAGEKELKTIIALQQAKIILLQERLDKVEKMLAYKGEAIIENGKWKGDPTGLRGPAGKDGKNGVNGKDGKNGRHGRDGKNGIDGKDGKNGRDGIGKDGNDANICGKGFGIQSVATRKWLFMDHVYNVKGSGKGPANNNNYSRWEFKCY